MNGQKEVPVNVKTAEALLLAIEKETEAAAFYSALAGRVKNPLVRRRLLGFAQDEESHREALSRLYWAQTGRGPGAIPAPAVSLPTGAEGLDMPQALSMALAEEEGAAAGYREIASSCSDPRTRLFLEYLVDFEEGHAAALHRELKLLEKDPRWHHHTGEG